MCDAGLKAACDLELVLPATSFCPLHVARGAMALKRLMNSFGITFVGKMKYKCVALRRAFCYHPLKPFCLFTL